MLDFNPTTMVKAADVMEIHRLLDQAMHKPEKRREYVGASAIGGPCERRIQYDFMLTPYDDGWRQNPRTLRIFQRGHVFERVAAVWLADAGFHITQTGRDGKSLGFSVANGAYAGHVDRVVTGGPIRLAYPFIWECKALGSKLWKAISSKGVEKASPQYADQISQYQSYMNLTNPALFFAINSDTMKIHMEFVEFDRQRAQSASDKAVSIIMDTRAGALRPRCTDDSDFWACKDCPFRKRCWG
jgi:hypothetical protein